MTANGGAWFIVFQTSCDADERSNKAIFGGATGAGYRIGAFFPNGTDSVRGYFWNNMQSTTEYPTRWERTTGTSTGSMNRIAQAEKNFEYASNANAPGVDGLRMRSERGGQLRDLGLQRRLDL